MSWVVDTCILIDILENDPQFGKASARCLKKRIPHGLLACPISLVEMAPALGGDYSAQHEFLSLCGVGDSAEFSIEDVRRAHQAWHRYVTAKRSRKASPIQKRPVADIMIGAFACRFQGLITRNRSDFQPWFSELKIIQP